MAEPEEIPLVFEHSSFAIIRGQGLTDETAQTIEKQITLFGGEAIYDEYPEHKLDLSKVTHIVATTTDFPDYYDAVEQFKHVVKPEYIPECVALERLTHPRRYSPDPNLIMSDVVAMCIDLPQGDKDAILGGILAMGGNYSPKLTSQVTHIVALTFDAELQEQIDEHGLGTVQILPHWFDQCLRLGKKISDTAYVLPHADLTIRPGEIPVSTNDNKHIQDALTSTITEDDLPEGFGHRELKVFKNKKVLLDNDLDLSPSLRNILNGIIQSNHGMIVTKISTANMLICKYREGHNYVTATLKKIDVGSLSWLYFLIVHNVWTSPFKRLLHYPLPKQPLPGFEGLQISVSNYGGEARTYLENLIAATGAERTKTFKLENTHLITAHTKSEKVEAAEEWNKIVVNHLWVEESFAKWEKQPEAKSRYLQFPDKIHLGEVVGQTSIDRDVIMAKFIPQSEQTPAKQPRSIASPSSGVPGASPALDMTKSSKTNAKLKSEPKPTAGLVTPSANRVANLGKENVTPATGSSRKSKMAAAAKLHDMADDIALYQKESKRAGGVMYGGRKAGDEDRIEISRKRSAEPEAMEPPKSTAKRQRTTSETARIRLLVSSHKSWQGKPKKEAEEIKKLRQMGIEVVDEAEQATHIAVPQIMRTPKFLTAIAYAPVVLSDAYIDACLEEGEYQDPKQFVLVDKKYEQEHDYSLAKVMKKAKTNGGKLFEGLRLYAAEKVTPEFKVLELLTKANGGTLTVFRGRVLGLDSAKEGCDNKALLLADNNPESRRLWSKFQSAVRESEIEPRLLLTEWLVSSAFRQELLRHDKFRFPDNTDSK